MIEEAIAKLTAAVEANTVALNAILASAGTAPAAAETPESKPAKEKKSKPAVEVKTPAPKLEVVEPEAAEEGESDAVEVPAYTMLQVIDASKQFLQKDRDSNKPKLEALRKQFDIETVKELKEDQFAAYMAELAKL